LAEDVRRVPRRARSTARLDLRTRLGGKRRKDLLIERRELRAQVLDLSLARLAFAIERNLILARVDLDLRRVAATSRGKHVVEEREDRSEERRVGRECRSRWWPKHAEEDSGGGG